MRRRLISLKNQQDGSHRHNLELTYLLWVFKRFSNEILSLFYEVSLYFHIHGLESSLFYYVTKRFMYLLIITSSDIQPGLTIYNFCIDHHANHQHLVYSTKLPSFLVFSASFTIL